MGAEALRERIEQLLALETHPDNARDYTGAATINEMFHGSLTLLRAVYGPGSAQEKAVLHAYDSLSTKNGPALSMFVQPAVLGALRTLRSDIDSGVLGSIERRGAGEALGDFATLARHALAGSGDDSKNVSAVLTAALFEDTIRRMGSTLASVSGRPRLEEVVGALKTAGALTGSAHTTALGFLKFRNDALHADWDEIIRGTVESCLTFTEALLREHFA